MFLLTRRVIAGMIWENLTGGGYDYGNYPVAHFLDTGSLDVSVGVHMARNRLRYCLFLCGNICDCW